MGKHPKTGEKRMANMPFKIDRLPPEVAEQIQKLRAAGKTFQEISDLSMKFAGQRLPVSNLQRWCDVRVAQVLKEIDAQAARARALAGVFKKNGFEDLPESAVNALGSEIFGAMEAGTPEARQQSLGGLVFLLSKMITAQTGVKKLEIEKGKLKLAERRLEQIRKKLSGAKDFVEGKKKLTPAELAKKLDEIYGLTENK